MAESSSAIESHIRQQHLGRCARRRRSRSLSSLQSCSDLESDSDDDHEEEFYWTEVEVNVTTPVDSSTASGIMGSGRHPVVLNGGSIVGGLGSVLSSSVPGGSLLSGTSVPQATALSNGNYPPSSGARVVQGSLPRAGNIITIHNNSNQYSVLSSASTSLPNSTSALLSLSPSSVKAAATSGTPLGGTSSSSSIVTVQRLGGPHYYQPSTPSSSGNVSPKTSPSPLLPFSSQINRAGHHQVKYSGGGLSSSVASQYVQVSSPPTLSHMDMARPPHEDPEYRRQHGLASSPLSSSWDGPSSYLQMRESSFGGGKVRNIASPKASPGRGGGGKRGGENSKCRKFFGMDRRQEWCTQCRWKKACTRPVNVLP